MQYHHARAKAHLVLLSMHLLGLVSEYCPERFLVYCIGRCVTWKTAPP